MKLPATLTRKFPGFLKPAVLEVKIQPRSGAREMRLNLCMECLKQFIQLKWVLRSGEKLDNVTAVQAKKISWQEFKQLGTGSVQEDK